jgi:hypothetical protein
MVRKIFLSLALLGAPALATTVITVSGGDTNTGLSGVYIDVNGTPTAIGWMGGIDVSGTGIVPLVYRLDLSASLSTGNFNIVPDFSDPAADQRVAWLMQNEWPSTFYTGATLQTQGAAFQLAIWDILLDSGAAAGFGTRTQAAGVVSQSTGSTATPTAVILAAQQYETLSAGKTAAGFGVIYAVGSGVETLMGPTPEPAAMILICSGLAMIAVGRLRRRRSSPL